MDARDGPQIGFVQVCISEPESGASERGAAGAAMENRFLWEIEYGSGIVKSSPLARAVARSRTLRYR